MDRTHESIAAVVVTYNRKKLLGECLDSLLSQSRPPEALYIVDNCSTDGTYDFLLSRGLIVPSSDQGEKPGEGVTSVDISASSGGSTAVRYMRLPQNTGSAGGFNKGLAQAASDGYEWFWIMDDDTLTTPDALAVLVQRKRELQISQDRPFVLNSLVVAEKADGDELAFPLQELSDAGFPKLCVYHWRLSEVRSQIRNGLYRWACPFNGMFLPAQVVPDVGLPNPDLFIWGDESDFLWRIAKRFDVYTAVDSRVYHPRSQPGTFTWKSYYQIRNAFVVNRHLNLTVLRNLRLIVTGLVLGFRHGRAGLVLRAIRDGLAGRLGKRDDVHP